MARVETDKDINPTQLGIELGRVPLRGVQGEWWESDAVTQADLEAAEAAHVANDDYVDPDYVAPPDPDDEFRAAIEGASTIADLKAALLGTTGPGAEPRQPTR